MPQRCESDRRCPDKAGGNDHTATKELVVIEAIQNFIDKLRAKLRNMFARLRTQVQDPNPETLAGVVLGTSWGHIISSVYVGVIAVFVGAPLMALMMFGIGAFELWQNYHLSRHFHQVLTAELLAMTFMANRPLQVVNV